MKKVYVILFILSNQLFGATTSGQRTQEDCDLVLALQLVAAMRPSSSVSDDLYMQSVHEPVLPGISKPDHTLRLYYEQYGTTYEAGYHAWLNSRHVVKTPALDVSAKMARCNLQQKIIKQYAQEYMHGAHSLGDMIYYMLDAGYGWGSLLELFAQELFCYLLKKDDLQGPIPLDLTQGASLSFFIDMSFYPEPLRQFFTGVSLEHYDMHDMLLQLDDGTDRYPMNYMALNSLEGLQNIDGIDTARSIEAHHNNLTELSNEIGACTQLQDLRLNRNRFAKFPDISIMPASLTCLHLGSNQIEDLPSAISKFTSLQRLYLQDNQLTCLPTTIGRLNELRVLDLRGNKLTLLPDQISRLTCLTNLYLARNPLTFLPATIGNLATLNVLSIRCDLLSKQAWKHIKDQIHLSTHGRCIVLCSQSCEEE